ncbi:WD repeat and coiled-coil-containing protein [Clarias gariepinus]|uniref:WD repeat and coiled-coil-containing protein n=1 Tax=Clarias gariepinus TaxID=13013 RepID=UPI00234CDAEF|nr:WD repeat and coiled-coil-containing protein [Clarias gariepinus]
MQVISSHAYLTSMELGKAKLLRNGLNTLHHAIHPVHGIAWTDGRRVCLTSFCHVAGEIQFNDTNVLGEFEHVFGLFWGPLCCSETPALLAVQHKKHVTVWQLQLSALEQNKLLCTQTCEMSEPFPLLVQGCVWHPRQDVLAILTKQDVSVLFSVREGNRGVKPDIRGSGQIRCACWTKDGTRLVIAIGSALHSYIWNDIQKSLVACSFCPVFDVGGDICAIVSTDEAQVAVTTELPLDKICRLSAGIPLDIPNELNSVISEEDVCSESRRKSCDSARSLPLGFLSSAGPIDLTQILTKHRRSDPSPLIHFRHHLTESFQDSAHLILVKYERKATTTRKVSIPGILVPDVMAFHPKGNTVAVASNTCNVVLVYSIMASSMPNVQQIHLQMNERPKGLCFLSSKQILVMLGIQRSNNLSIYPSSTTDKYFLELTVRELEFDENTTSQKLLTDPPLLKNSCVAKEDKLEQLAHNMERKFARSAEVQQCLFKDCTQNEKKLMSSYPPASEPQYVHVTCQMQVSENMYTDERRQVLLCKGRLSLRVLQELFNLTVIEMKHGLMWITLVADADGFVPLTFKHQEELMIRSAKRKFPFKPFGTSNSLPLENQHLTNIEQ